MGTRYTTVLNLGRARSDPSWPSTLLSKHCKSILTKQTLGGNGILSPVSYITCCYNKQCDAKIWIFWHTLSFWNHALWYTYVMRTNKMHILLYEWFNSIICSFDSILSLCICLYVLYTSLSFCKLCILIVMFTYSYCLYALFCIFCFHRAKWHSPATLTEVFPCFFLSCKANARLYLAKTRHSPHSS